MVELLPAAGGSGSKFLLLQRPKDGLLAGTDMRPALYPQHPSEVGATPFAYSAA